MKKQSKKRGKVSCSEVGFVTETVLVGTYRSIFIPPNGTDSQKADAIDDMLAKLGFKANSLCTDGCPDATKTCRCTQLVSLVDIDDCELTLEAELDGTTYYKAVVTGAGSTSLRCRSLGGGDGCKCL